jgi:hypothetical protein
MNSGGWGFRDSFNVQRRPFHWDLLKGGSQQVKDVAEWWCKRMHGHNARYAGEFGTGEGQNKHADIRAQTRVLGVISTDDPENKLSIAEFKQHLNSTCGASVAHEYYYAQDITTAEQQRREAVNAMRTPPPESTTIMCFCDLVAPIFLYQTCEENQYYPEHVVVGTGFMDADPAAQAYDTTLGPGHQFENAFGLAQQPRLRNFKTDNDAARAFKATGREDYPHESSVAPFNYLGMVASLIEAAGPNLNPQTVEANATKLAIAPGSNADPYYNQRSFNPAAGDYTWIDTMREVFWSKQQTSEHNGEPGTYITLNQGAKVWFSAGQYPSGELTSIPPKPR